MKKNSRPDIKVLVLAAGLLLATLALLGREAVRRTGHDLETVHTFQRMAGGLGLGASVRPRWCFVNFDPRIEHCTCMEQPVPGGYCYCPEHSGTVSSFAPQFPLNDDTSVNAAAKSAGTRQWDRPK